MGSRTVCAGWYAFRPAMVLDDVTDAAIVKPIRHLPAPSSVTTRILLALLLSVASLATTAAPVTGRLGTDAGATPALTVHAWLLGSEKLVSVTTQRGHSGYTLELPNGRYWIFATPAEPGAPALVGGYTEYSICARDAERRRAGACRDHALLAVTVAGRRIEGVDVTDWGLADDSTAAVNKVLGRHEAELADEAQLAAPKFSEYPAPALAASARATALVAGSEPRIERDREALAAALLAPPNFAGRMALLRLPCGSDCMGAALVDLATGRVAYPPALDALPPSTACSDRGALQFRRDSRLLTVTGSEKSELVTRYFVWDAETGVLKPVAALSSAPGR